MPSIRTEDGVDLHYIEAGEGTPLLFVHEFAGDARSWEPQMRFFARRYRCIAYNARGYPPSDVPHDQAKYSQDRATDDIAAVIKALDLAPAQVVGLSMGAFAALHLGLRHPHLARSLTAAGGSGSTIDDLANDNPTQYLRFVAGLSPDTEAVGPLSGIQDDELADILDIIRQALRDRDVDHGGTQSPPREEPPQPLRALRKAEAVP
jgi:pimeloyl-ACP methyl ester carboxylesterase